MKLKMGDIVQNLKRDYSEIDLGNLKTLPAMTVGRVKKVYDGMNVVYVKFMGHPLLAFKPEELVKVRIPK